MHVSLLMCLGLSLWSALLEAVPFTLKQKRLTDFIEYLAYAKHINVLMPAVPAQLDALKKQVISIDIPDDLSVDELWDMLQFLLNLSGFTLYEKKPHFYAIATTAASDIATQPLDTYVDSPVSDLPQNATRIRYYCSLKNINMSNNPEIINGLDQLLKALLSPTAPAPIFDLQSHGFLITDSADHIANILFILRKLDAAAFTQSMDVITLFNATAKDVEALFQVLKKSISQQIQVPVMYERALHGQGNRFISDTTIVADNYTNSIIMLGRESALIQLHEFIENNLDVIPEQGQSILHVYEVQYLDAQTLATLLNQIATGKATQAQVASQSYIVAPEQFFSDIVVAAEESIELQTKSTTQAITYEKDKEVEIRGIENKPIIGGNRLIIAATNDKWPLLQEFISQLDQPQAQVILEVFIVDFLYDKNKTLASTIRNFTDSPIFSQGRQFLASHITPLVNVLGPNPTELDQDLLGIIGPNNFSSALPKGSLIFSFNDTQTPGIMGLLQALQQFTSLSILSHPYLVTTNHQKGYIESTQYRRTRGDLVIGNNGSYTIAIEDVTATLKVTVTPHIMAEDRLKLDIEIIIEDFEGGTLTRLTRNLNTTAAIKDGEILAMGGLLRDDYVANITYTPLLAQIPLIGNLFQKTNKDHIRSNICLFVSPTIVFPRSLKMKQYTDQKTGIATYDAFDDNELINMRDPIQRMLFKHTTDEIVTAYMGYDHLPRLMRPAKNSQKPEAPNTNAAQEIKALLAYEDNPLLGIKHRHMKHVLNA